MSARPIPDRATKDLSISVTVTVDEGASQEEIADRVSRALAPMARDAANVSDVAVRTLPRGLVDVGSAGYESRLWEKATCKEPAMHPGDIVINPVDQLIEHDLGGVSDQVRELQESVERLNERLGGS